ncbi:transcriptional regulator [Lactococcus hodotermopsidis]|uniref:Transcriptional regulator n=1 Tax=Pseudolactococcus hodotermopsidis TaxID=2709157 RepID=A0A6A0B8G4_9LACT|nr:helix-turn-helix transcriptional regulator [Lactococcus hodotermopsidis]GFH41679.1 transcriptional regulator [Lactococcus hodotermopsidis]
MRRCPINKIKEYRKQYGVSQETLAEEMEVTRQTIISLEKEKYTASLNLAYKLAQYFQTTIEDIFFSDEEGG